MSINKESYRNNCNFNEIVMYTAEWCPSCMRIKPHLLEYLTKNDYELIDTEVLSKQAFKDLSKDHVYIPSFYVNNNYIQTSKIEELLKFIASNNQVLSYNSDLDSQ
jgi:thiol-disulfide isomerase/thioredoxin